MARSSGKARGTAKQRTPDEIETCVLEWVNDKFTSRAKKRVRESLWSGVNWSYHLVHGVAREPKELEIIEREGVVCHAFSKLLDELSHRSDKTYSGSAGGDLAEIVAYYKSRQT